MTQPEGLAAWLRLTLIPRLGGETQRKLLAAFGLPEAIFAAGRLAARTVAGDRAELLFDCDPGEAVDRGLAWAGEPGLIYCRGPRGWLDGLRNLRDT